MLRDDLIDYARRILGTRVSDVYREPGYLLHHGRRVAALAEKLYIESADLGDAGYSDSDFAGALFHDIGKGFPSHHTQGAQIIGSVLADFGEQLDLDRVAEIVGNHCLREPQKSEPLYIAVVQDADLIDHCGAQGVWIGLQRTARTNSDEESIITGRLSDDVEKRIEKYRSMINLDISKRLFEDRIEFEQSFYRRLRAEYGDL